jgi:hypothetical protein
MRNTIELTVGALVGTIAISVIAVLFLLDSFLGPIFRDDLYCRVGLGTEVHGQANVTGDGWTIKEIRCQHGTLWEGMTGRSPPQGIWGKVERIQ